MKRTSPTSCATFASASVSGLGSPVRATSASSSPSSSRTFASGPCEIGPVEARGDRTPLELARLQERRQRRRHVVEDPLPAFLLRLDLLPPLADAAGGVGLDVAEDVRVAADELGVHGPRHLLEIALALLLQQQGEEVDLEEEVAELVEQLGRRTGLGCIRDLVRLLDGVRDDRPRRLLAVPGAVAA